MLLHPVGLNAQVVADAHTRTITTIEAFWGTEVRLKNQGVPYRFEFDVLYYDPIWQILQVSDGDWVEYISTDEPLPIESGQRIVVTGTTRPPGEASWIKGASIEVVGQSQHEVVPVNLAEIDHLGTRNQAVEFVGLVSDQGFDGAAHMRLNVASEGKTVTIWVLVDPEEAVPQWQGSVVRVRGVYAPKFEPNGALRSIELFCPGVEAISFEAHVSTAPQFDLPRSKAEAMRTVPRDQKIRLVGEVVGGVAGESMFLRDETGQVTVALAQDKFWGMGDVVEAIGYPDAEGIARNLTRAWVRPAPGDLSAELGRPPNRLLHRVAASVMQLSPVKAAQHNDVRLEGVVTWSNPHSMSLFLQDATGGIQVRRANATTPPPLPGMLVRVEGTTMAGGFAPQIQANAIQALAEIALPTAKKITLEQAMTGVEEAQWVELTGFVCEVRRSPQGALVELSTVSGPMSVVLPNDAEVSDLLGAVAAFQGVATAVTDDQRKLVRVDLRVPSRENVEVFEEKVADVFDLPNSELREVGLFSANTNLHRRIKVEGTVLHWSPRGRIIIEDQASSLMVLTRQEDPLVRGDRIEVVGFYGREGGRAVLREGRFRSVGTGALSTPQPVDPAEEVQLELDGHLVTLAGRILEGFRLAGETRAAVQAGRTIFEVRVEDSCPGSRMRLPATGSLVQVDGVYLVEFNDRSQATGFHLLLGASDQMVVLQAPQWWTPRRVLGGVMLLVVVIGAVLFWVKLLRRRVALQTRQIEEQMQRATQLEADLNRVARLESLGTLAGGIAQDFSTLLGAVHERIAGVANQPGLSTKVRTQLDEARASSLRARDLAHQLSAFSEGAVPQVSEVDLVKTLREMVNRFDLPHTIAPRWQLKETVPLLPTDGAMLRQVVQNLLFNAVQAMPRGGELGIQVAAERFEAGSDSLLDPGDYLRIQLRDSGEGIAEKNLGRVFDPYFTTRPGAQGLGLSVVYSLVRRLRGKVVVESTPMVGTRVTLWLPCFAARAG